MSESRLKVGILIVSTTASKNPSTDKSELVLRDVIDTEGGGQWDVVETKIVSDHVPQIQRQIMLWADIGHEAMNLILTTGGTGFAVADHTPEVCSPFAPRSRLSAEQGKKLNRRSAHCCIRRRLVSSMLCWHPH
jgi:gephyrin